MWEEVSQTSLSGSLLGTRGGTKMLELRHAGIEFSGPFRGAGAPVQTCLSREMQRRRKVTVAKKATGETKYPLKAWYGWCHSSLKNTDSVSFNVGLRAIICAIKHAETRWKTKKRMSRFPMNHRKADINPLRHERGEAVKGLQSSVRMTQQTFKRD